MTDELLALKKRIAAQQVVINALYQSIDNDLKIKVIDKIESLVESA